MKSGKRAGSSRARNRAEAAPCRRIRLLDAGKASHRLWEVEHAERFSGDERLREERTRSERKDRLEATTRCETNGDATDRESGLGAPERSQTSVEV